MPIVARNMKYILIKALFIIAAAEVVIFTVPILTLFGIDMNWHVWKLALVIYPTVGGSLIISSLLIIYGTYWLIHKLKK